MGLCSHLLALSNQEVNRLNEERGVSSSSAYASGWTSRGVVMSVAVSVEFSLRPAGCSQRTTESSASWDRG